MIFPSLFMSCPIISFIIFRTPFISIRYSFHMPYISYCFFCSFIYFFFSLQTSFWYFLLNNFSLHYFWFLLCLLHYWIIILVLSFFNFRVFIWFCACGFQVANILHLFVLLIVYINIILKVLSVTSMVCFHFLCVSLGCQLFYSVTW